MAFKDTFRGAMSRATEPQVLFPCIALFLLAAVWGKTFGLIKVKTSAAEHAAAVSSRELLSTYEAQVVRALREIDLTLFLVKYWPERSAGHDTLADLKNKGLLPPDLLFVVSIVDRHGAIVESTRQIDKQQAVDQDTLRKSRGSDDFVISRLPR